MKVQFWNAYYLDKLLFKEERLCATEQFLRSF